MAEEKKPGMETELAGQSPAGTDFDPEEAPTEPIQYASPIKRVWAWVGVAYMLIIVMLMTYLFATARYLTGIGGIMAVPALGGLAASAVCAWRESPARTPARAAGLAMLLVACFVLAVLGLVQGIPGLLANFGG